MDANTVGQVAGTVVPYLVGVASAYGSAVVAKVGDAAVDASAEASVGVGRRLLRRLLGREESRAAITTAVEDVASTPGDEDFQAALRVAVRKALTADPQLLQDVTGILRSGGVSITASGERAIAAQTISGIAVTGDNAQITR